MDDLAAPVTGTRQALLAETTLLRLSGAIGLHLETHDCQWLNLTSFHPQAVRGFAGMPIRIQPVAGGY
eukprot:11135123-Prorocentrum_lima.AAC.1